LSRPTPRRLATPPLDGLASRALPRVDFVDAYATRVDPAASVESVARLVFSGAPPRLMRLRDALVRPFGLKTSPSGRRADPRFVPGERLGLFTLFARAPGQLLLGADDRHLDFRICLSVPGDGEATLTTLVHFRNGWGRLYFSLIRPFHVVVAKGLLRRAGAAVSAAPPTGR
jgi:hypothetical protein